MVPARTLNTLARIAALAFTCACMLPACKGPDATPQVDAAAEEARAAFASEQNLWRMQRSEELTKADGWTSLIGMHWLERGPHYVGSSASSGIRLALGPAELGLFDLRKDGRVHFSPARGLALTMDGEPLRGATVLRNDMDPAGANKLGFDDGKGVLTIISRGDRLALRVKHADAPSRTQFAGLQYWPADAGWNISGKFVPNAPGKTIDIASIIGTTSKAPNPGRIEFVRNGKQYRIEALDEGGDTFFLVFADRTNGHGSYGAGRFMDVPKPDAQGRVALDFNRAYNPPCAFTPFATCPLPPRENRLDLAITAGEKAYAKTH